MPWPNLASVSMKPKTRVTLVFDDGFAKSSLATAKIFEQYNLRAVFAVLASGLGFATRHPIGDFALWNDLQSAGHRIQPHGYTHARLPDLPHAQAFEQLDLCLASFREKLTGFDPKASVYHFTYNLATPALVDWLLPKFAAVRTAGNGQLTQEHLASRIWPATSFGPEDPYDFLIQQLELCKQTHAPAFIFNLHGLDGEAWGATSSDNLRRILDLLTMDQAFDYWLVP
jgi:peptidoglycan/xylan/chitin deacetylase (PgdA/CDA1 family)